MYLILRHCRRLLSNADGILFLGYVRVIARRNEDVIIEEMINSIPYQYTKAPLLRD